ncbi:clotting factor B [Caerostris darwini]|uniref:Clotting factor B n=1 Tax=Caerostris darwini TaxID=1538125 RepID=A0AAV4T7N9_9ARAC|nr:clotting factor B [Caerostris darwini]
MYLSVINFFVLTVTAVLGDGVRYPEQNLCPSYYQCHNISLCPGVVQQWNNGYPPTICGWDKDIPSVCCITLSSLVKVPNEDSRSRNTEMRPIRLSSISQTGCGRREYIPPPSDAYIGGFDSLYKWSWLAAIFAGDSSTQLCGATVIDDRHILTAAHCFDGRSLNPQDYSIRIGEVDISKTNTSYEIQEIKLHEDYTPRYHYNDIAIIRLAQPVGKDAVCILEEDILQDGDLLTGLGWGRLSFGGRSTTILQVASGIPVVGNEDCNTKYQRVSNAAVPYGISDDFICAGLEEGGLDACQGDSGGPLVYEFAYEQWALMGIVSFGHKCGEPGFPGVYTRVSSFLPWIKQYIQNQRQSESFRRRPTYVE